MKKAKAPTPKNKKSSPNTGVPRSRPLELEGEQLTTNQGLRISDNHNQLKAGLRGPTLIEDHVYREKMTSFDHERIPERVVHARGAGAFGYFECTKAAGKFCSADFLGEVGKRTPVLARFSTVGGSRGSADTARDVRGFAVKMYTQEGNWDFVGNNIPVFFIQDAMKFPDLIHAVKPEPHNEIPQASSAHDTFWDFISLMPESTHMIFWLMSDRAIPRSFRLMEGFGVHTYRMVNAKGEGTFVKFHWKPKLGVHSLVWDEALSIAGKDPDFHRRDLFEAIEAGAFPEWEFGVQVIPEADEFKYDFDLLDSTKLVPEELVPVTILGKMVLDRNPDNYFTEIEMAVFHPGHLVPGIDLSNDPLLQGRLFSYTDTQITRLGGPNFHELPVNRPIANINNNQRDGFGRQTIPKGRVSYEPNSIGGGCPFHSPDKMKGFVSQPEKVDGHTIRARSPSFGDHFSQAKLFFRSQSLPEQNHIRDAFIFELSKVEIPEIRERVLATLMLVDADLTQSVATGLGMPAPKKGVEQPSPANYANNVVPKNRSTPVAEEEAARLPKNKRVPLPPKSKALSMVLSAPEGVSGRKVAFLVSETSDGAAVKSLRQTFERAGVVVEFVAPGVGPLRLKDFEVVPEKSIASIPSVVYDGVVVMTDKKGFKKAEDLGHAVKFIGQAFKHLKTVGMTPATEELFELAHLGERKDALGVVSDKLGGLGTKFLDSLKKHRHWDRANLVGALPY